MRIMNNDKFHYRHPELQVPIRVTIVSISAHSSESQLINTVTTPASGITQHKQSHQTLVQTKKKSRT